MKEYLYNKGHMSLDKATASGNLFPLSVGLRKSPVEIRLSLVVYLHQPPMELEDSIGGLVKKTTTGNRFSPAVA
jgi:hypothetical protein